MENEKDTLLWGGLDEIARETEEALGGRAYCFINLYNDWMDIWSQFSKAYSEDLPLSSLVAADFYNLGKDLHWMHRLLHWGNYATVHRILRYDWELMFRACYADIYVPNIPGDEDVPGWSVDEKVQWLENRETELNYRTMIKPILRVILPDTEQGKFGKVWRKLNRYVHPTNQLRNRLIGETALAVRDSFDQEWAEETVSIACEVFDLIWFVTLDRFSDCLRLLNTEKSFGQTPLTSRLIQERGTAGE